MEQPGRFIRADEMNRSSGPYTNTVTTVQYSILLVARELPAKATLMECHLKLHCKIEKVSQAISQVKATKIETTNINSNP